MDIHKPEPVHSWRDFIKEIGIIVIGVTIALTGEQLVETLNWKHKVADAEAAMRREFSGDLAFSAAQIAEKDCADKFFARMETAVRDRRADTLRQLAGTSRPSPPIPGFSKAGRPPSTARFPTTFLATGWRPMRWVFAGS